MFNVVPTDPRERLAQVDGQIADVQRLRYNAAQIGDAAGFGRLDRMVEALYTEQDGLRRQIRNQVAHDRVKVNAAKAKIRDRARRQRAAADDEPWMGYTPGEDAKPRPEGAMYTVDPPRGWKGGRR